MRNSTDQAVSFQSNRLYIAPWLLWSTICLATFAFASITGTWIDTDGLASKVILTCIFAAVTLFWAYEIYCISRYYVNATKLSSLL